MPTLTTIKKHGFQNFMGGKLSKNDKIGINLQAGGLVEACYHTDTAEELLKMATQDYWDENIGFIIAVWHLLSWKAQRGAGVHTATKMRKMAGLTKGTNLQQQLNETINRFVKQYSPKEINIAYAKRGDLVNSQLAYVASGSVRSLLPARDEVVGLVVSNSLSLTLGGGYKISQKLAKRLAMTTSPIDHKILAKLGQTGPETITRGRR